MPDYESLDGFLKRLEPRMREPLGDDSGSRHLLEETAEELKVAVEELRVAHEELVEDALRTEAERAGTLGQALRWRDALAAAPDPFLITDTGGVIRTANPAAGELLGVRHRDLPGKPLAVFVVAAERRDFRSLLAAVARDGTSRRVPLALVPRRRLALEVEASLWPVPAEDGVELAWLLSDVTARQEGETARDEQAHVLRAVVDSLPAAVAAMDLDGSVLVWNRAARRLLGWSEEELAGRPNPAVPDELFPVLDAVRATGRDQPPAVMLATEAERPNGTRLPVELALLPLLDSTAAVLGTLAVARPAMEAEAPADRRARPDVAIRRMLLDGGVGGDVLDRLRAGIAAGLHVGRLRTGDRLPSIREAADATGADHRAVSTAYRRLAAEGMVEIRNRRGAVVVEVAPPEVPELNETAEWLAGVLEQAAALQVRLPSLPDLVRRWTAQAPLRCACADATEDARTALAHEMAHQWGMTCIPVPIAPSEPARAGLAQAIREADLVVTTHFHAYALRPIAESLGRPLVVAALRGEVVEAVEERLRSGPVDAVVADPAYGRRLQALAGGERLRIVSAGDARAMAALDPDQPRLVTLAAQQRLDRQLRLLVPAAHMVAPIPTRALARLLVRANLAAPRG